METKKALVVGASGVIGHALVRYLEDCSDWKVVGMGRGARPPFMSSVSWITADLLDPANLTAAKSELADITHVFYAAYIPQADLAEEASLNALMLDNCLLGLSSAGAPLQRVVLFQGGKVYGLHLGPVKTPMRESDPRHMPPNFYYDLEDTLARRANTGGYSYALLRPDIVLGSIAGKSLNLAMVVGAYAAFCKELDVPFRFPGSSAGYGVLMQATDADLLARISLWAATASIAADQAYNVTNGDLFRWEQLWATVARSLSLEIGPPLQIRLVDHMKDKADLWVKMSKQYGLIGPDYQSAIPWSFGDWVFHTGFDVVSDLTKLRIHGCNLLRSTEETLIEKLGQLQAKRLIPPIYR